MHIKKFCSTALMLVATSAYSASNEKPASNQINGTKKLTTTTTTIKAVATTTPVITKCTRCNIYPAVFFLCEGCKLETGHEPR